MDTSPVLRRARPARARWILSLWALLFAALVLPAPAGAQKGPRKRAAAEKSAGKTPGTPPAPRLAAPPKIGPTPRPPRTTPTTSTAVLWGRVVDGLASAYATRYPDRALAGERVAPGGFELNVLGAFASQRWRDALSDALAGLARLEDGAGTEESVRARTRLVEWIQLELLLLDARAESSSAPASYLDHAARTLRAVSGALWMEPGARNQELARIVAEVPEHLREARLSLVAPAPDEIALALEELEDLRELVARSAPGPAPAPNPQNGKVGPDPLRALDGFQAWLLERSVTAGGEPARLGSADWLRCLRLATGRGWQIGELKARALRELARLDLEGTEKHRERPRRPAAEELARQASSAAEQAVRLGLATHVLRDSLEAERVQFTTEVSPRAAWKELALRPAPDGRWLGALALPHPSWSPERTAARHAALRLEHAAALGVRHGLAGEAYWTSLVRGERAVPPMLLDDRLVREGLGLYALVWTSRVEHEANPFHGRADLARAFGRQHGREAARLLAALELHAERCTQAEVAQNFRRRTGADAETATAEIHAALRDPLHGIAYLGLLEILALEERLAGVVEPHRLPRLVLQLLARNPGLRPSDLTLASVPAAERRKAKKKPDEALEISGPAQQEQPRSR